MAPAGNDAAVPGWFVRATAEPAERCFVEVDGCPIHYLRWGDSGRPGLAFVPPSGGHAHWFSHVAPLLADQFDVIAIDPSGCGDLGRRDGYSLDGVVAEIIACCEHAGMCDDGFGPVVVGHSAGAQWVVRAAMAHGERLRGVIAIDGLRYAELEKDHAIRILSGPRPAPRPPRVYATREEALGRFRLTPAPLRPVLNTFIVDHIAAHSFREVEGGWSAKYDPAQGSTITLAFELRDVLKELACQAAAIYSEHTHLADATVCDAMGALNAHKVPVFVIPETSHYPQIDQPIAFVAAIKGVALGWIAQDNRAA